MGNGKLKEVFRRPRKTLWQALRVTPTEKESIRAASRRVGLSMSAYLLGLHNYAIGDGNQNA